MQDRALDRVGPGGVDAVKPYKRTSLTERQGLLLRLGGASGARPCPPPIVDYLQEKVWEPIGAEADATWLVELSGQEATY